MDTLLPRGSKNTYVSPQFAISFHLKRLRGFTSEGPRCACGGKGSPNGAYRSAGPDRRALDAYGYFSCTDMLQLHITKPPGYCRQ